MTCCKSTSTGVGAPTTAPTSNDPDIYIEQPSGQIWVWNGTSWIKPPVGAVSYNSTTRVLTVGSSSVTLPIASKTEYGVVKLADPATDPNNPIEANTDGTLTINCTKLIDHCGLATKAYVDGAIGSAISGLSGAQIVNLLTSMSSTDLAGLACKLKSSDAGNLLQCRAGGLYYGITPAADVANQFVDAVNGDDSNSGTRASPLRTVSKAFSRIVTGTYGNIYLHENQLHIVTSESAQVSADVSLYTYGTGCDALIAAGAMSQCNWSWFGAKVAPRATIQFFYTNTESTGKLLGRCLGVASGHTATFYGIDFQTSNQANIYQGSGWQAGIGSDIGGTADNQSYRFRDCTVTINSGDFVQFMSNNYISIERTEINKVGSGFALTNAGNGQIEVGYTNPGDMCGAYEWNSGVTPATFKTSLIQGFVATPPTYRNVISSSL